jgi:hypothetical protein
MSEFAIVMDYERRPSSKVTARDRQPFNQGAYFGRMERFKARRNSARDGAVTSAPQHLDARLLEEGEALEDAWSYEIATLIAKKRLRTPEADAVADAARAACALVVGRIEKATAMTLDGLKVKARAILWTRNGEPLGAEAAEDHAYKHA